MGHAALSCLTGGSSGEVKNAGCECFELNVPKTTYAYQRSAIE
jgi:hypothetical protein